MDCGQDCVHVGDNRGFVIVAQNNRRYWGVLSVLLVPDTLIGGDDGVEAGVLSGFEQRPIGKPCPSLGKRQFGRHGRQAVA